MAETGTIFEDATAPYTPNDNVAPLPDPAPLKETESVTGFDAFSITVGANGVPVPIIGMDMARNRARILCNTDDVYLGTQSGLAAGTTANPGGFPIPRSGGGFEYLSHQQLFVRFVPSSGNAATSAVIAIYVERIGV